MSDPPTTFTMSDVTVGKCNGSGAVQVMLGTYNRRGRGKVFCVDSSSFGTGVLRIQGLMNLLMKQCQG